MRITFTFFFTALFLAGSAQPGFEWLELQPMPEPVANNAVVEGYSGDTLCVYSFTGIGLGLTPNDIHLKAWRYNTETAVWSQLPDVPDAMGKIAAGASRVGDTLYIIGGYNVFPNFSETTSPKVHRFNTQTNSWMGDGADTPTPIDDHVQAVWRDSLIFCISGWSNNGNVNDVQIYDPYQNAWTAATSTPNTNTFTAFGASGTIIGDTIYYMGGAQIAGFSFNATSILRRGIIDPNDPTAIVWQELLAAPGPDGYRMAATNYAGRAIWIGGSGEAYNFDGLAYSDGEGVEPLNLIRSFGADGSLWITYWPTPFAVMDLRGIAVASANSWIVAGGIGPNQVVSDRVFQISTASLGVAEPQRPIIGIAQDHSLFTLRFDRSLSGRIRVIDMTGKTVAVKTIASDRVEIDLHQFPAGLYVFALVEEPGISQTLKVINP